MGIDLRKRSRQEVTIAKDAADYSDVKLGCMLRIADATEAMAQNYTRLINERDRYQRWYEEEAKTVSNLRKEVTNLLRIKNRYKNQNEKLKAESSEHTNTNAGTGTNSKA